MPYNIAGIDVHKKVLVVVVAEVSEQGEWTYERGTFGATAYELQRLADWFQQRGVQEVGIESTAQYWRPVWGALEQYWTPVMRLREGAGPMARKLHFGPGPVQSRTPGPEERLSGCGTVGALTGGAGTGAELCARSEQRLWRTLTHRKQQLAEDRTRFQNRLEALLEQMHLKLSSCVSDLLGVSARRRSCLTPPGRPNQLLGLPLPSALHKETRPYEVFAKDTPSSASLARECANGELVCKMWMIKALIFSLSLAPL